MRIALPHDLGREEVRRRLKSRSHEIADHIPGGIAQVDTSWTGEDRMNLAVGAMGQQVTGHVDIEESQVVFEVTLPAALSFVQPIIEGAIRSNAQKLLESK
ncbi:polyhydroxyalkanoic acid system family protein [Altererythrobacter sp.]|uniref:polyhydroxyalkanoic acid system family protein n=1 Tax=Altererythrobacter sp. TaxID=1872480 RepID=UPI003D026780